MSRLADRYERLYPQTGCSEAQKEERMQRLETQALHRSGRRRGITVPELPWKRTEEGSK